MENPELFNQWKDKIENFQPRTLLDCFRELEVNLSTVCNLKCPFCPQSKGYKREPKYMSIDIAKEIAKQLKSIDYKGYICFGGHGEPSLNPNFEEIVNILKDYNPQIITNGKLLDKNTWERIDKIAQIKVSVHDWNNIEYYKEKFKNTNAWFRNHDVVNPQMNLYNRGGYLGKPLIQIKNPCYLPWYWLFIDTDGKYLYCASDWEHISEGSFNIYNTHIKDFFLDIMEPIREKMDSIGGRQNLEHCKNCDMNGMMMGLKFVEFWRNNRG